MYCCNIALLHSYMYSITETCIPWDLCAPRFDCDSTLHAYLHTETHTHAHWPWDPCAPHFDCESALHAYLHTETHTRTLTVRSLCTRFWLWQYAAPHTYTLTHPRTLTLRSLCTTFWLWQYSTAWMICQNIFRACGSGNLPCLDMYSAIRQK